jgi:hypothetical protein
MPGGDIHRLRHRANDMMRSRIAAKQDVTMRDISSYWVSAALSYTPR